MKHVLVSGLVVVALGVGVAFFSPVFAAPNLKNIEAKVQRQAEKRQELISPVVEAQTLPITPQAVVTEPAAHFEPYTETLHSQYLNGLIKLRTISGQLYLSLWR